LISFPQSRFPSFDPTMTMPSSYTMQMRLPSGVHFMPRTVDWFRLLIISSYLCDSVDREVGRQSLDF